MRYFRYKQFKKYLFGLFFNKNTDLKIQSDEIITYDKQQIDNIDDLFKFIKIADYNTLKELPNFFYKFLFNNKIPNDIRDRIKNDFQEFYRHKLNDVFKALDYYIEYKEYNGINDFGFLKYLIDNQEIKNKNDVTRLIAINGHLKSLKYAYESGYQWNENTIMCTAYYNHLECLKYLHYNKCLWDEDTTSGAALNGNLECLRYAHESGCPWDERTTRNAAKNGHIECLKYAHEKGCPWDKKTMIVALDKNHIECLKYAIDNNCPTNFLS